MELREKIARIINPDGFEFLELSGRDPMAFAAVYPECTAAIALAKADQILSLLSTIRGLEEEVRASRDHAHTHNAAREADASTLVSELLARAASYRQSGPSAEHTAALLDQAAIALGAVTDAATGTTVPGPHANAVVAGMALHHATAALVSGFMLEVGWKLARAEQKYGYSDGWKRDDWEDECRRQLHHHAAKGDPRDVAAYAAFCWHHGWPTSAPPSLTNEAASAAHAAQAEGESSRDALPPPTKSDEPHSGGGEG